jgi:GT2 family glycosyltransferase
MSNTAKKVFVNILNYNSERYLNACIRSVQGQTYPSIELLITDNGSKIESVNYIKTHFPDIRARFNPQNIGFGNAHNQAIAQEDFDYYLPLNSDIILGPNFVTEMVSGLETSEQIGAANGKIFFLNENGHETSFIYSAGEEFNRARRPSSRGYKLKDQGQFDSNCYVFGVNGACPLYKKEFLEAVRINNWYFDDGFFMYYEDVDLTWRGLLLGYKYLYVSTALAFHYGFGAQGLKDRKIQYEFERNRFISLYKNDMPEFFLKDLHVFILHEIINLAFYLFTSPTRVLEYFRAIAGLMRAIPRKRRERAEIMKKRRIATKELREYYRNPWLANLIKRRLFFSPNQK